VGEIADPRLRRQSDVAISEKIAEAGVTVSPLSAYDVGKAGSGRGKRQGLMFGYAAVPDAKIAAGIRAISAALQL
jgi:DNA-binding transcriptional MocR family regulator